MRRLLLFIGAIALVSLGLAWLLERPGSIVLQWSGYRIETSVFIAALALFLLAFVLTVLIQILRAIWHGPEAFRLFLNVRRKNKGLEAIARGLVAIGSWDVRQAQRAAAKAETYLGTTPLTLLLRSQTAQLSGNREEARASFEAMLADPQTRLLGLRGLYVEAERSHDAQSAALYAKAASEMNADLPWASNALLLTQAKAEDWDEVLVTLKKRYRHRLIDRAEERRLRAVALMAKAKSLLEENREQARLLSYEAHRLDPALVPASVQAAALFAEIENFKQASRILERGWSVHPHPALAAKFMHLRPGDSAKDRLKRAWHLQRLKPNDPESLIGVAMAAAETRDFALARQTLKPLLDDRPSQRVCLLMAKFAEAEDEDIGAMRAWLDKAIRAPRDAQWVGDGQVLADWAPVSPVSGELGGVTWRVPHDEPLGLVLLQEQMPAIPAPLQNQERRSLQKAQPATAAPSLVPLPGSTAGPFVPDDPGPLGSEEDSLDHASGERLH